MFIDTNLLVQARFASAPIHGAARRALATIADVLELDRAFAVLEDGPTVTAILLELCRDVPVGGRQVHDANILATTLAPGERRLLTFNDGGFVRFAPRIEVVPP